MKKRTIHKSKYKLKKSEIIRLTAVILVFVLLGGINPVLSEDISPINKEIKATIVEGIAYLPLVAMGVYVPAPLLVECMEQAEAEFNAIWTRDKGEKEKAVDEAQLSKSKTDSGAEAEKTIAESTGSKVSKIAYLTFDDGLDSKVTPQILDILKQYEVKATFFILGNSVSKNKDVLKRMVDEGHIVGNHTYTHKKDIIYTDVKRFSEELARTSKAIYDAVGITPKLFRPPYGAPYIRSKEYKDALSGYKTVLWNVDSMDSRVKGITSGQIVASVKSQLKNKNKVTILFHSTSSRQETAKALPEIIEYLKDNGYSILRLE